MEIYERIFQCSPDAILVSDARDRIVCVNAEAERLLGYRSAELTGQPLETLVPGRICARRRDGRELPVDVMLRPLETSEGSFVMSVVRGVPAQQTDAERKRFAALADNSKEFIGMCDREFRPFYVNPSGLHMVGLESIEAACSVKVQDFFFPEDQAFIAAEFFPRVVATGNEEVEIRFRHFRTGDAIWMLYNVFSLLDATTGAVIGWATVSRNIHDRRRAENALRASEERLRLAQQVGHVGTFEWNVQTGVNTWSLELERMYGLEPGTFAHTQLAWEELVHPADRDAAKQLIDRAFETGLPIEGEWRVVWPSGSVHWIAGRFQVFNDDKNQPLRLAGINLDITARKDAEDALLRARDELERRVEERTADLMKSLREKEVLLREIHHRVKNNLAVIGSLFYLQSTGTHDSSTLQVLRECQDRVRSMALIHERLYESSDLASIDFAEYTEDLAKELFRNYRVSAENLRLVTHLDEVLLDVDRAIPCGLILNELLANALKHAFPSGAAGEIRVALHRELNGAIVLSVADTGIGLPDETSLHARRSLGMRLIHALARQLKARIEFVRGSPGTEARLTLEPWQR